MISDHFSPWLKTQVHAPYAWSVLGAITQVTNRTELMTYVTAPIMGYHPAVVAQQAATAALLSGGRFTLSSARARTSTSTSSGKGGRG